MCSVSATVSLPHTRLRTAHYTAVDLLALFESDLPCKVRRATNSAGNCYRLPIWQRSVWKRQRGRSVCVPCLVPTPRALENRPKGSVFMIWPRSAESDREQRAVFWICCDAVCFGTGTMGSEKRVCSFYGLMECEIAWFKYWRFGGTYCIGHRNCKVWSS